MGENREGRNGQHQGGRKTENSFHFMCLLSPKAAIGS